MLMTKGFWPEVSSVYISVKQEVLNKHSDCSRLSALETNVKY